jgi:hypothetical protein
LDYEKNGSKNMEMGKLFKKKARKVPNVGT